MTNRENFFNIINGRKPERIPFTLSMCESLTRQFKEKYGTEDYLSYFGVPFAYAGIKPSNNPIDYASYFKSSSGIDYFDEWGLGYKKGKVAHFARFISPMEDYTTKEQVNAFPMSDYLADYRWEGLAQEVALLKQKDMIVVSSGPTIDVFEPSWYLRGLENMMCDFILDPEMAKACLDRTMMVKCAAAERLAAAGVDVIIYGDDVGTERGMMMSVEVWREWLKPRLAEAIKAAKSVNPDVLCYYHTDGDVHLIIDELIEAGIDILNPVQPECMDPAEIYGRYKDRISFWGTIGTQTTMPFGSVADVTAKTKEMIELCRDGGKLIIAPTHLLEPEVPIENIEAFVNTVKSFKPK
jgi:uroporphyrinogen decarboxylase